MIKTKKAKEADVLTLLGRVTMGRSHGHYLDGKSNLLHCLNNNFAFSKTKQDINKYKNLSILFMSMIFLLVMQK